MAVSMVAHRIIIYGNSGAGKTTIARSLQAEWSLPQLVLDAIAWEPNCWAKRRPLASSNEDLQEFIRSNENWILEGCYGDLIELALPFCTDLRFVNPGIEVCVENCRKRDADWKKYGRPEDDRGSVQELIAWVCEYAKRDDEYSLSRHRAIFDRFEGKKIEYKELPSL